MDYKKARSKFDAVNEVMQQQQACLANSRRKLKALRRKEDHLRKWIADVCFVLFVWTAPAGSLVLAYAAHATSAKQCDAKVCLTELEERYLKTDIAALNAIAAKEGGVPKTVLAEAKRFQYEQSLYHWIQIQNAEKGVAPNTNMVQKHLKGPAVEPVATATASAARDQPAVSISWVQRFRRRWPLKRGKFMPGERLTCDVIRDKVTLPNGEQPPPFPTAPPNLCFVLDQKEGPPDGPQMRAANCISIRDGSFLRPHFWPCLASKT